MGVFSIIVLAVIGFAVVFYTSADFRLQVVHFLQRMEMRAAGFYYKKMAVGDCTLSYCDNQRTDLPVIVLVHGFSSTKETWAKFAKHLSKDYRIIVPDMLGHGQTSFINGGDFSIPAQVKRIVQLLDILQIEKVHIAGNSMGGSISATFAINHAERTLTVGLQDPAGVTSPTPSKMDKLLEEGGNPFLMYTAEDFDRFYAMCVARPENLPKFLRGIIANEYIQRREELTQVWEGFARREDLVENHLSEFNMPMQLQWGDKDEIIHVSGSEIWQQGIPQLDVKIWQGVGHLPYMEIPKKSAECYREFLLGK